MLTFRGYSIIRYLRDKIFKFITIKRSSFFFFCKKTRVDYPRDCFTVSRGSGKKPYKVEVRKISSVERGTFLRGKKGASLYEKRLSFYLGDKKNRREKPSSPIFFFIFTTCFPLHKERHLFWHVHPRAINYTVNKISFQSRDRTIKPILIRIFTQIILS